MILLHYGLHGIFNLLLILLGYTGLQPPKKQRFFTNFDCDMISFLDLSLPLNPYIKYMLKIVEFRMPT